MHGIHEIMNSQLFIAEYLSAAHGMLQAAYFFNIFAVLIFIAAAFVCRIVWNGDNAPKIDLLYHGSSSIIPKIVSKCHSLNENYIPTYLWGKSGHIQSFIHTFFGRFGEFPDFVSKRHEILAPDGSVLSYDIFEPDADTMKLDEMVLIVPGICNHAESKYIKAFSYHLISQGYRVVVFNHTGALKSVELRRPRIFTYGHTLDLHTVVMKILETEKVKKLIGVGFSLGGNIIMKYLGEKPERQKHFLFAVSVCQGYDIPEAASAFRKGENLRWLYNYGLTRNMLKVVRHHQAALASHCRSENPPLDLDWEKILSARELHVLDEEFTMKLCKESDMGRFYRENSSSQFMDKICLPMLIMNAVDDPIVPNQLLKYPKNLLNFNKDALFVIPPYGGHLGFFEGGYVIPNQISWMDRMLAEFFKVATRVIKEDMLERQMDNNNVH